MTSKKILYCFISIYIWFIISGCSIGPNVADSGSGIGTGNPAVLGKIVTETGTSASGVKVILRRQDFLKDTSFASESYRYIDSAETVTGVDGTFRFDSVDSGEYYIEAISGETSAVLIDCDISQDDSLCILQDALLAPLKKITGMVFIYGGPYVQRYIQVYGLDRVVKTDTEGTFEISVPAGLYKLQVITGNEEYQPVTVHDVIPEIEDVTVVILSDNPISTDYTCDSLILRAVLDSNNMQAVSVDSISEILNSRIEEIELHGIGFATLPSVIGGIRALRDIDIQGTLITSLPSRFGELVDLIDLNLYNNQLTTLPLEITNLTKIEQLDLSYNKLKNLPPAVKVWADTYDPDWESTQDPNR